MMGRSAPFRVKGRLGVGEWLYPFGRLRVELRLGDGNKSSV